MTATSQRPSTMSTARVVALGYGFVVYAAFLVVFLCAIGFVDNLYLTVAAQTSSLGRSTAEGPRRLPARLSWSTSSCSRCSRPSTA